MAGKDLDKGIELFQILPAKLQNFDGGRALARRLTEREGHEAGFKFAEGIESPGANEGAIRGVMHQWVQDDEAAAVTYAEDQKSGRDKSVAILGILAGKGRKNSPQEVLDWVKTLAEDEMRRLALINLAWLWDLEDNRVEVERILNDKTINMEDRNVMEAQLKRIGVTLP